MSREVRENGSLMRRHLFALGAPLLVLALTAAASSHVASFRYFHGDPLNNLQVTPGATFNVGLQTICQVGYSERVRNVPYSEKLAVYYEYGIYHHSYDQYEIDHLIPLELGGNNSPRNLWPELNDHPSPDYLNSKDILENRLHDLVCSGQLGLRYAQRSIASNWVALYHSVFGSWPGKPTSTPTAPPPSSSARCSASAAPANDGYAGDYVITVRSNQPDTEATAIDGGDTWRHETNASGSTSITLWHQVAGEP